MAVGRNAKSTPPAKPQAAVKTFSQDSKPASPRSAKNDGKSSSELVAYYKQMLLLRRFEERAGQMYGMGLIGGFCHLYIGQEAVVVGLMASRHEGDTVITSYRDHGHMLACGMDPKGVMAELTGRAGGYSKGKGGSMHMFSREKKFFGGHGIVGAQIPLGTGLAFAHRYKNEPNICLTFMGDGALNQGQVYESFNMAALWKLPVIYVIENNQYGMGTSIQRSSARATELYMRGQAYGIPGVQVDGMDVLTMKEAGEKASDYVRSGKGPYILEAMTYRYRGHSMSDPAKYRTKEEVQEMREKHDPLDRAMAAILKAGLADEAKLKQIDRDIREQVAEAAEFAQSSPEPDAAELWTDVIIEEATA